VFKNRLAIKPSNHETVWDMPGDILDHESIRHFLARDGIVIPQRKALECDLLRSGLYYF